VATESAYLDRIAADLWSRSSFSFIPDRDLPPPDGTTNAGDGPRLVFAGFPSDYSLAFLLALLHLDVRPVGIVTSPGAHPAILGDNALSRIAEHLEVPLLRAWRINDEHSRMHLEALRPDAVVMASFDQIVGNRALSLPRHGWLNIHPSLIPEYRGPEPVYWALADGAPRTGITLHRAAAKVDSGGILAQAAVLIEKADTAGTLTKTLTAKGVELLPVAVRRLLDDDPGDLPDMSRSTYRTSVGHRPLSAAAGVDEAERMVRAGVPNMPAWAQLEGREVYVMAARAHHDGTAPPHSLHFPDGNLEILAASERCGCHHDTPDCPHRIRAVADV
jgi:methionyl-tRNA formyltransferase